MRGWAKAVCVNCLSQTNKSGLVGGFNPFEKYESHWESFFQVGVKFKKIETTT